MIFSLSSAKPLFFCCCFLILSSLAGADPGQEEVQQWISESQTKMITQKGTLWDDKVKITRSSLKNFQFLSVKEDLTTFNFSLKTPSEFQFGTGSVLCRFEVDSYPCLAIITYKIFTDQNPLEFFKIWNKNNILYSHLKKPLLIQVLPLKHPLEPLLP